MPIDRAFSKRAGFQAYLIAAFSLVYAVVFLGFVRNHPENTQAAALAWALIAGAGLSATIATTSAAARIGGGGRVGVRARRHGGGRGDWGGCALVADRARRRVWTSLGGARHVRGDRCRARHRDERPLAHRSPRSRDIRARRSLGVHHRA